MGAQPHHTALPPQVPSVAGLAPVPPVHGRAKVLESTVGLNYRLRNLEFIWRQRGGIRSSSGRPSFSFPFPIW